MFAIATEDRKLAGGSIKEWVRPSQDDKFWRVLEEYRNRSNKSVLAFLGPDRPRYYLRKCDTDGDQLVIVSKEGIYTSVQDAQEAAELKDIGNESREAGSEALPAPEVGSD